MSSSPSWPCRARHASLSPRFPIWASRPPMALKGIIMFMSALLQWPCDRKEERLFMLFSQCFLRWQSVSRTSPSDRCVCVPIIMLQWGLNAHVSMGTFTVKPKMEVLTVRLLFQDLTFGFSVRIRFRLGLVLRLSCSFVWLFGWEERRTVGFNQWKGSLACRSKKPWDLLYIYPLLLTQCGPKTVNISIICEQKQLIDLI